MGEDKGFTLIELILSLAIYSIIALSLFSLLKYSINSCNLGNMEDEVLLNGRYALEYIKREIKAADEIVSAEKFDSLNELYKDNFGFVIMNYNPGVTCKYNYSTYYFKDNKIYRIATNRIDDKLPKGSYFSGHNEIAEYIISIEDTSIDFNTKIINLSFVLGANKGKEILLESKLSIRCPIIY